MTVFIKLCIIVVCRVVSASYWWCMWYSTLHKPNYTLVYGEDCFWFGNLKGFVGMIYVYISGEMFMAFVCTGQFVFYFKGQISRWENIFKRYIYLFCIFFIMYSKGCSLKMGKLMKCEHLMPSFVVSIMQLLMNWVITWEAAHWPSVPQPFSWLAITATARHSTFPHDCFAVHWANTGPTWVLLAPERPHVDPMILAIRLCSSGWSVWPSGHGTMLQR